MIDPRNPAELAQALIRCRSVTPQEGGALVLLERVLKGAGFETELQVFADAGTPDVTNLFAKIGSGRPALMIAGHTDVVPPGDEAAWTSPPFGGEILDGVLYGRGAVDMKGGLAAAVAAVLRFLAAGMNTDKGSISLLVTGDEEGPAINGMPKLLAWARERGEAFDHCLLAEPSSRETVGDEIKIGRRGSLSGVLTVHGKQGHVAYPKAAENPIRRLMSMLDTLLQPLDYGTAHFERSNLELTSVDVGNETVNIIPAKAVARFNVRFNDAHTLDSMKTLIGDRLARAAGETRYELSFLPGASSSFVAAAGPFVDLVAAAISDETGERPKLATGGGTSDARFIHDHCPVVELGLVNATMHQVDEQVPLEDLDALMRIYERVLARYFGAQAHIAPVAAPAAEEAEAEAAAGEAEAEAEVAEAEESAAAEGEESAAEGDAGMRADLALDDDLANALAAALDGKDQ